MDFRRTSVGRLTDVCRTSVGRRPSDVRQPYTSDVRQTFDGRLSASGRPTDFRRTSDDRRPSDVRRTSRSHPSDVRWTSARRLLDVRWTSDGRLLDVITILNTVINDVGVIGRVVWVIVRLPPVATVRELQRNHGGRYDRFDRSVDGRRLGGGDRESFRGNSSKKFDFANRSDVAARSGRRQFQTSTSASS